jgi:hypothetical protein
VDDELLRSEPVEERREEPSGTGDDGLEWYGMGERTRRVTSLKQKVKARTRRTINTIELNYNDTTEQVQYVY